MTRFVSVDLSRMPVPDIVETLSAATIRKAIIADFVARYPAFTALLESDPVIKLCETVAQREIMLRARINAAVRAVMFPTATGADLDNLAALFLIARKDSETDAAFRQRIHLHIEAFASAGPQGAYIYHALDAAPTLLDANAIQTAPGYVTVALLGAADGVPTAEEIVAVQTRLSRPDIRPLTDVVNVVAATLVPVNVTAELVLRPGPDATLLMAEAAAALTTELNLRKKVGRNLSRSSIFKALQVEGVERVILTEPAADVIIDEIEAVRAGTITLTIADERDE